MPKGYRTTIILTEGEADQKTTRKQEIHFTIVNWRKFSLS